MFGASFISLPVFRIVTPPIQLAKLIANTVIRVTMLGTGKVVSRTFYSAKQPPNKFKSIKPYVINKYLRLYNMKCNLNFK